MEPDLSVICDRGRLTEEGCNGAPDWVIEIALFIYYKLVHLMQSKMAFNTLIYKTRRINT